MITKNNKRQKQRKDVEKQGSKQSGNKMIQDTKHASTKSLSKLDGKATNYM